MNREERINNAIELLAEVLAKKWNKGTLEAADKPVPRLYDPPLIKRGKIDFYGWATILRALHYPWYYTSLKIIKRWEKEVDKDDV